MRHRKARHKLSRDTAHRRSLLRNLCREVIEHERIKTSQAKAKAVAGMRITALNRAASRIGENAKSNPFRASPLSF